MYFIKCSTHQTIYFGVFNVCIKLLEGFFLFCCEEKRKKPSERKRNTQSFTTAFGCLCKAGKPAHYAPYCFARVRLLCERVTQLQ